MKTYTSPLPPDMRQLIKCEVCDWNGMLFACKQTETYSVTNTNHLFSCLDCGSDLYNWVEDKLSDESAYGLGDEKSGSPPKSSRRPSGIDSEEDV